MVASARKNPFPGPRHYDAQSIAYWVPRLDLEKRLLDKIRNELFVLVYGPSGSGKSSILCGAIQPKLIQSNFYYNQWSPDDELAKIQRDMLAALANRLPTLESAVRKWLLDPTLKVPSSAHDVVLIFDQLDHLFSPAFTEVNRREILKWLKEIAVRRSEDYHGNIRVVFGIRDDYLGLLLSFLVSNDQPPGYYFQIPRLRLSEILKTAFHAVPEWRGQKAVLLEQLKETYIHKDTKEPDPEINAPLAQIILFQRFGNEGLDGEGVSFSTVMQNYFVSKTKALAGAAGTSKALSFFKTLAQKFVNGKQKRFCSAAELAAGGAELKNALPDLIAANLITAVGAGDNQTYTLTHDSLCEILTSEYQQAAAVARMAGTIEEADKRHVEIADVHANAMTRAITSLREESAASLHYAERHSSQLADVLQEGRERELASLRQAQKEQIANLNQLHLAALEHERAAGELAQRELQLAHKREQEQLKQFHSSQLAQLRQQHVSEVEGVSRALGQKVADTQAESERRASEQQRVREEVETQLAQEKTARSGIATQLVQEKATRFWIETQLAQEQTARSGVATQLAQEQTTRSEIATELAQERTARSEVATQLAQEKAERSQVERQLSQVEMSRGLIEAELSKTRRGKAETERALNSEEETSKKWRSWFKWGGVFAGGALTLTSGTAGYGWLRAQTLQTTLQIEQVEQAGRKKESAKCKADEASCQQLSQAERRVAVAQCLLQGSCGPERFLASVRGNPNSAASLLLEIPADLRSTLPLWSATAKQILQRGRLRVVTIEKGALQGIVYGQTGEVQALLGPEGKDRKVLAFQDEGTEAGKDSRLNPNLRSTESAPNSRWREKWDGRLNEWPGDVQKFLTPERLRDGPKACVRESVKVPPNNKPFALIPFLGQGDSRVLILTRDGILLRDAACRGLAATKVIPETWLMQEGSLGRYPYQHAVVNEKGTFVVAAIESTLRAAALPPPSAGSVPPPPEVLNLDVEGSVLDVRFRPGENGRLAVASGHYISFWDLQAAQHQDVSELPRFATDCITKKQREQWLGETAEAASAANEECIKDPGRKNK